MTPPEQRTGDTGASWDTEANSADLFDVLTHSRRRFVIAHLRDRPRPRAVADVATALTKWERDVQDGHVPKDEVLSRYVSLHHVHLPKMAHVDVIDWNHGKNTIEVSDSSDGMLADVSVPTVEETG